MWANKWKSQKVDSINPPCTTVGYELACTCAPRVKFADFRCHQLSLSRPYVKALPMKFPRFPNCKNLLKHLKTTTFKENISGQRAFQTSPFIKSNFKDEVKWNHRAHTTANIIIATYLCISLNLQFYDSHYYKNIRRSRASWYSFADIHRCL